MQNLLAIHSFLAFSTSKIAHSIPRRPVYQIGSQIAFDAPWLGMALDRIVERYKMSPEQLMVLLRSSPLFDASRDGLVAEGVSAALGNDPTKAIHILVPQIEHMLRSLAGLMGIPKTTAGGVKGTMQARGLGDLLNDKIFRNCLEENIRLYLIAFLVDQRGLNLRNRIAHGLMELHQMEKSLSNRLLHVLLVLSMISIESKAAVPQAFRLVRHTYNERGMLAERAVLSGRHQTRDEAVLAAKSEAAKNSPWEFNEASDQWRITDKHGKVHVLLIEGFLFKS